ncbi:hypothetical protein POM88_029269 [Heracleum sosnowskyi]|uniref:Uncharacterized protein n=1 Tax=Heracleum sosnowskyi TaxID=360622 RepID=A0AAD8HUF1_9APIA|nr:hypothetical protein POM88_029269 [Heracleum sosnowskyi]
MRGRSYSPSPPPRGYGRRGRSPSPRLYWGNYSIQSMNPLRIQPMNPLRITSDLTNSFSRTFGASRISLGPSKQPFTHGSVSSNGYSIGASMSKVFRVGNIRNYDETVTEGASSSKSIGKPKAKISGKNLRNCDVATRPTKKNRGQTKPVNVPQGLNFHAQTVADTSSNQHAKRVAQVWLSLDSSVNQ